MHCADPPKKGFHILNKQTTPQKGKNHRSKLSKEKMPFFL